MIVANKVGTTNNKICREILVIKKLKNPKIKKSLFFPLFLNFVAFLVILFKIKFANIN